MRKTSHRSYGLCRFCMESWNWMRNCLRSAPDDALFMQLCSEDEAHRVMRYP